jgi:hypothetical protein
MSIAKMKEIINLIGGEMGAITGTGAPDLPGAAPLPTMESAPTPVPTDDKATKILNDILHGIKR